MPDVSTQPLLPVVQSGARQTSRGVERALLYDILASALCMALKLTFYCFKYLVLFRELRHTLLVLLLVLGEAANCAVSIFWCEVVLCFEAAVFKQVTYILEDPEASDKLKSLAVKANRKSASIADSLQALLEIGIGQQLTSFMAFSKVGCGWASALGASMAMSIFAIILQSGSGSLVSQLSADRRRKENM